MAVLNLQVFTARPTSYLTQNFETAGGKQSIAQRVSDYIERVLSGNESAMSATVPPSIAISIRENTVQATGNFSFNTVIATNSVVVNGVTFTAIASGATGNQFNVGGSDTITAQNAAATINASASALISGYVTAVGSAGPTTTGILTITSSFYGISGNQVTISSPSGTITASGARLTGGAVDPTAQTLSF